MDRREFLAGSAAAMAGFAFGDAPPPGAQATQPNILMILVDQWRQPRWTPQLRTPAVDRLAAQGVSFSNHFVSASPCSPSRACLLTGTYTTQNGMYSNCDFVEGDLQPSLDPKIPTLGHVFRDKGYRTPYRGKWHLTRYADRNREDAFIDYGFEGWGPPDAPFGGPPYWGKIFDPLYTNQSLAWLADPSNQQQPWFLVSSLVDPHDICGWPRYYPHWMSKEIRTDAPPDNWNDDLSTKPRSQHEYLVKFRSIGGAMNEDDPDAWRRYLDYYVHCMQSADHQIGRILDALEASGQAQNTIVIFTSDHGDMGGSHRLRTKGNFAYEEVMNVPLIIAWPGVLPEGAVSGAMVSNVDVMPTLCNLAGIDSTHYMPGADLVPLLRNP
ncbi:MAG: sulfatase-like hydrolase/transferase, partial [bacterium]|nr:sulfatase-like hydrolase/transferase [bacterium]